LSGGGGGEAAGVRGDVVDGVGGYLAGVDFDRTHIGAVEEGLVAEVGISRLSWPGVGYGCSEIRSGGCARGRLFQRLL